MGQKGVAKGALRPAVLFPDSYKEDSPAHQPLCHDAHHRSETESELVLAFNLMSKKLFLPSLDEFLCICQNLTLYSNDN